MTAKDDDLLQNGVVVSDRLRRRQAPAGGEKQQAWNEIVTSECEHLLEIVAAESKTSQLGTEAA